MKKALTILLLLCSFFRLGFAEHFLTYIIPCYNCDQWIEEAVESIYQQSIKVPFEVICTDDGSSDNTYETLLQLAKKHPEIRVFQHEQNQGGAATRNTCVKNSKGDLIFCLDSDNVLEPNTIQKLIDHLDQTKSDIACFGELKYFVTDDENPTVKKVTGRLIYHTKKGYYRLKDVFRAADSPVWSGNYLYTRKSFDKAGGYPVGRMALDTFTFGFMQLLQGYTISYLPNTFYWHRQGIDSYYVRASKANRVNTDFCEFLLSHRDVIRPKSVKFLEKILQEYHETGQFSHDIIWCLAEQKVRIKRQK